MNGVLVDSNVLIDILEDDPAWYEWSVRILSEYAGQGPLYINSIVYTEISICFDKIEELEESIRIMGLEILEIPREALFMAGKVFLKYRRREGRKISPLPDFFIGAHAAVLDLPLVTRDTRRIGFNFPTVKLIAPVM